MEKIKRYTDCDLDDETVPVEVPKPRPVSKTKL